MFNFQIKFNRKRVVNIKPITKEEAEYLRANGCREYVIKRRGYFNYYVVEYEFIPDEKDLEKGMTYENSKKPINLLNKFRKDSVRIKVTQK